VDTDVVFTLYAPLPNRGGSSSGGGAGEERAAAEAVFERVAATLEVADFGLFA